MWTGHIQYLQKILSLMIAQHCSTISCLVMFQPHDTSRCVQGQTSLARSPSRVSSACLGRSPWGSPRFTHGKPRGKQDSWGNTWETNGKNIPKNPLE